MIIKHGPKRETPDIYSKETYNQICDALGIKDNQQKIYFKETLERAALSFIKQQKRNNNRLTNYKEKDEFKKLAKSLNKTRKIFDKLCNSEQMSNYRFFDVFNLNDKKDSFNNPFANSKEISEFFKALENQAIQTKDNIYFFGKSNKTQLTLNWLWRFSDDWEEISDVTISEGRYDEKELKYVSPAMRVLDILAKPLGISNSNIAEAIKIYRVKKNESQDNS